MDTPASTRNHRLRGRVAIAAAAAAALIVAGGVWIAGRADLDSGGSVAAAGTQVTTTVPPVGAATTSASLATEWTASTMTAPTTASSAAVTTTAATAPPVTEPPTTTTTGPPPPNEDPEIVTRVQTRLAEMGYSVGPADGRAGGRTASAVMAFQKVEGLERDGVIGAEVLEHLDNPQGAVAGGGGAVPRLEVDLQRQVVFAVTGSGTRIFNSSTGNNEPFTWPDGTPATAYTPTGDFSVLRRIDGMDEGPLGSLYRPLYFYDGWAIHGSGYVPAYPASHGCARVSNSDQDWIWDNIANGTPVVVY